MMTTFAPSSRSPGELDKPVRIGVNAGSLDQELLGQKMDANNQRQSPLTGDEVEREALVESAIASAEAAVSLGLPENKIIISCKVSRLPQMVEAYREISRRCDLPLHIGLTEAGMGTKGIVATTAALSTLLYDGIGDTIRSQPYPRARRRPGPRGAAMPGDLAGFAVALLPGLP